MAQQTVKQTVQLLVDNLEFYTSIWDSNSPTYHDANRKRTEMQELAEQCGTTKADVEKKYTSVRTRFRKV